MSSEYLRTLNFSLFKAVPDMLKKIVYDEGDWLIDGGGTADGEIGEFDYFVDHMNTQGGRATFRFFHTVLTHAPVKYDEFCNRLNEKLSTYQDYLRQDTCGFVQVSRILERLKVLGIYDNSYIVISSDHGRNVMLESMKTKFSSSGIVSTRAYGYSHVMLMIKPLGSIGEFKQSAKSISLMHVSPLIISSINNTPPEFASERKYFYYNWSAEYHDWSKKTLPPFEGVYVIGASISEPSDWVADDKYISPLLADRLDRILGCGEKLSFGIEESTSLTGRPASYISTGLSYAESWGGRWSDSASVSLYFKLDKTFCTANKLVVKARGLVSPKHRVQRSRVTLNGEEVGYIVITLGDTNPKDYLFNIPVGLLKEDQVNILHFTFENLVSPKSLGINNDQRFLAMGIYSLSFY